MAPHECPRATAQAAEKLWPAVFATPAAAAQKARVLEEMQLVRPVIETGYENVLQVRARDMCVARILRSGRQARTLDLRLPLGFSGAVAARGSARNASRGHAGALGVRVRCMRAAGAHGADYVPDLLTLRTELTDVSCARGSSLLPEYMSKWQLDRGELVELFGRCAACGRGAPRWRFWCASHALRRTQHARRVDEGGPGRLADRKQNLQRRRRGAPQRGAEPKAGPLHRDHKAGAANAG
jgi:hypothetical protein